MSHTDTTSVPVPSKRASVGGASDKKGAPLKDAAGVPPKDASAPTKGPGLHRFDEQVLKTVESVIQERWTCRHFDETRSVDEDLIRRILHTTMRAPTGYNLQPWHAVVVQDAERKKALCTAALGQPQVGKAAFTVVFAGDMEAERNAPKVLEMGLESGYIPEAYAPLMLGGIHNLLYGGPLRIVAFMKSVWSSLRSRLTGNALLSVPVSMKSYAWKQTMIPVTTFLHLCTAAGLNTCVMEGIDEGAVRKVVGLPDRYTVPVIVSVGYAVPPPADEEGGQGGQATSSNAQKLVWSPRFAPEHTIRWEKFK